MTSAVWFVVVGGVSGGTVAAVAAYRVHMLRVAMRVERAELIKRIDAEKQSVRLELGAIRSVWAELAQDIIRRGATGREIAFGNRMDRLLEWSQTPTAQERDAWAPPATARSDLSSARSSSART